MARRKKAEEGYHREQIANAAAELFQQKGIKTSSMDELAQRSGYSKATIYVYYQDKDEIIDVLAHRSMCLLHERIHNAIQCHEATKERYDAICLAMFHYQTDYPFYFDLVMKELKFETATSTSIKYQIYRVGEEILKEIAIMMQEGIAQQQLRHDIHVSTCVFTLWASFVGVIMMATQKAVYIDDVLKQSKQEFLQQSFEMLYESIRKH